MQMLKRAKNSLQSRISLNSKHTYSLTNNPQQTSPIQSTGLILKESTNTTANSTKEDLAVQTKGQKIEKLDEPP